MTSTHRALGLIEILDLVFYVADDDTKTRGARVCKSWSVVALDRLWYELVGLRHLFELLCPIEENELNELRFTRRILPDDWIRFQIYAPRIHKLYINDRFYMDEIFKEVRPYHPSQLNLSNLDAIRFSTNGRPHTNTQVLAAPLFLHPGLKTLSVDLDATPMWIPCWIIFLRHLARLSPNLTELKISSVTLTSFSQIEENLVKALQSLRCLQKVSLPKYALTSSVASALAELPKLSAIDEDSFTECDRNDVILFSPDVKERSFSFLQNLSLYSKIPNFISFLQSSHVPNHLTSLHFGTVDTEILPSINSCINAMTDYPLLTELTLNISNGSLDLDSIDMKSLTFNNIRPLLQLHAMQNFRLNHYRPITITEGEIAEISDGWPNLRTLWLNPEVFFCDGDSSLNANSIDILSAFARYLPDLQNLSLHINGLQNENPPQNSSEKMKNLYFGNSYIEDPNMVADYIFGIYPSASLTSPECPPGSVWPRANEVFGIEVDEQRSTEIVWRSVKSCLQNLQMPR